MPRLTNLSRHRYKPGVFNFHSDLCVVCVYAAATAAAAGAAAAAALHFFAAKQSSTSTSLTPLSDTVYQLAS